MRAASALALLAGALALACLPSRLTAQTLVTPAIEGVVKAGVPVELVREGFEAVEGPVPHADGSLLFTNNRAGKVMRLAGDGSFSTWYEGPGGANALTWTPRGELAGTLTEMHAIGIIAPGAQPRVLVDRVEGTPFNRPNDLVATRRGDIFFSDTVPLTATGNPALVSAVYQLTPDGKLRRVAADIPRPNGVALSPDERTLYVANTSGEWVIAFALDRKGEVKGRRDFAKLALPPAQGSGPGGAGADGLAVDEKGRLFVATALGVQVFSPRGEALGTIALPKQPQNLAFAGRDRSELFVVGRGAVFRIPTQTRGPHRAGK